MKDSWFDEGMTSEDIQNQMFEDGDMKDVGKHHGVSGYWVFVGFLFLIGFAYVCFYYRNTG